MDIEQKIIEHHRNDQSSWHKPRAGVYHASQIYKIAEGKITPEQFFAEQDFPDITITTMELGKMYHSYVQSMFPEADQEKQIDIKVGDFKIVGRIDLVLEVPIELKTCSKIPASPYPEHIYQLQCYLEALNADHGYITYIQKDPRRFPSKNFKVVRDMLQFQDITQKVATFHEKIKEYVSKK